MGSEWVNCFWPGLFLLSLRGPEASEEAEMPPAWLWACSTSVQTQARARADRGGHMLALLHEEDRDLLINTNTRQRCGSEENNYGRAASTHQPNTTARPLEVVSGC